jgi:hypothetical protein
VVAGVVACSSSSVGMIPNSTREPDKNIEPDVRRRVEFLPVG